MGRVICPANPGSSYDSEIRQADTRYTPTLSITVEDLPGLCGQQPGVGQSQPCRRLGLAQHLHRDLAEIRREIAALSRMRSDWRARNLIGWIEFATRRLEFQMATWEFPPCACGDRAFPEPTHDLEASYPDCTC